MENIPETVKAYTAGLLERAQWSLLRSSSRRVKSEYTHAFIKLAHHSEPLVEFITFYWGATVVKDKNNLTSISFSGKSATNIATMCLPYLISKRNHALIFDAHQKIVDSYLKKHNLIKAGKFGYDDCIVAKMLFLKNLIINLNNGDKRFNFYSKKAQQAAKIKKINEEKVKSTYYGNIFDFFGDALSSEDATKAKSIFDDLLK
jgi:hypothetical protein